MKRRRRATVSLGALMATALLSGCGSENFPASPTPVATSGVVLQSNHYQGSLTLGSGVTTSLNMTMIARGLAGDTITAPPVKAVVAPPTVTGSFETGTGLSGTIQGSLTGSLDNGVFNGSLTANTGGRVAEQHTPAPSPPQAPHWCPVPACGVPVPQTV